MDILQEWNKGTNTIGTDYNQPKIRLMQPKELKNKNKTYMRIKENISRNSYESYQASEEIIDRTPTLLRFTSLSLFN